MRSETPLPVRLLDLVVVAAQRRSSPRAVSVENLLEGHFFSEQPEYLCGVCDMFHALRDEFVSSGG